MTDNTNAFSVFETVTTAWDKVKGSKAAFWAVLGCIILLEVFLKVFDKIAEYTENGLISFLLGIFAIAFFVMVTMLFWGVLYLGIRRASGEQIHFDMIKHVFDAMLFLKVILLYLLIGIPLGILYLIPMGLHALAEPGTGFGAVLSIIAAVLYIAYLVIMIFVLIRLYLAKLHLIALKGNPWEAIKISYAATESHVWQLIGLMLLNCGILIISIIPLGIGLIWSLPYLYINYGIVYRRLVERNPN